jgi:hemolysin activation/secretion protein
MLVTRIDNLFVSLKYLVVKLHPINAIISSIVGIMRPIRRDICIFSLLILMISFIPSANSAEIPALPRAFNPYGLEAGLVGRTLSATPTPLAPKKMPIFSTQPTQAKTALSEEMAKIRFVLNQVKIEGNHVIPTSELERIFAPSIHKNISLADLQKLVDEVSQTYQNKGYFLSKALLPAQSIQGGIVTVKVVEGFISHIEIQGITNQQLITYIKHYEKNIVKSKPAKLSDLERVLMIINDVPGIQVKSVLAPDPKVELASTLTLVTTYKPIQATLTYDNFQTRYLGPDETTFYTSLDSLLVPGGTTFLRALSSNKYFDQLNYFEIRHNQTLGTDGLVLSLDGYQTRTNPRFILTPLEIHGFSGDGNVGVSYPLIRSRARTLIIQAQGDYVSSTSEALSTPLYNDQIRDLTVTTQYTDVLWKGEDAVSFVFDEGFDIFGANAKKLIGPSRIGATPSFVKLVLTASRTQYLNDRFSIYALVTSQYANKVLYSAETMIFGGPYIGRGYDWAQFTADQGVAGKAEFRANFAPNFPFLKQIQYYAFYDAGALWSKIPLVPRVSGTSAGFGIRAAPMDHVNIEAYVGKPLTTPNATQVIEGKSGRQFMGFAQITAYL